MTVFLPEKEYTIHHSKSKPLLLEKLGLSPSPNGESLLFSYTIIHKINILSDSIKKGTPHFTVSERGAPYFSSM